VGKSKASETMFTEQPVAIVGEDLEALRWMLEAMQESLDKPVLDYGD
jgi:hypothetical protein